MTTRRRQRLMYVSLGGAILFGLYMKPWERPAVQLPTILEDSSLTTVANAENTRLVHFTSTASVQYASEWPQRDPFARPDEHPSPRTAMPAARKIAATPDLRVQGIIAVDGQMACVIRGEVCRAGSQVSGWRIEIVQSDGIWVVKGIERSFLGLP